MCRYLLSSSPEQEIKSRREVETLCAETFPIETPAFIGEVAYLGYRAILLDSFQFESVGGIHFDPGTHRGCHGNTLDVFTFRA